MFSHRKEEANLPGWLWFFLILPVGLFVLLLYRQKRLPQLRERLSSLPKAFNPAPRYTEPDSIPLEIRTGEVVYTEVDTAAVAETGADASDSPSASARVEAEPTQTEPVSPDDLKIIEGIGPSISGILRDSGIRTFRQLAETQVDRLVEILSTAGLRRLANPATWPEQARLAAEGNWDELKQLQDTLKGGRRQKSA
jgi:predicted flap endonuclease-1-like 5' DNA nuclease